VFLLLEANWGPKRRAGTKHRNDKQQNSSAEENEHAGTSEEAMEVADSDEPDHKRSKIEEQEK
jgi:hypothetical protein